MGDSSSARIPKDFKKGMEEFRKEMERMRKEMEKFRKELKEKQNNGEEIIEIKNTWEI